MRVLRFAVVVGNAADAVLQETRVLQRGSAVVLLMYY